MELGVGVNQSNECVSFFCEPGLTFFFGELSVPLATRIRQAVISGFSLRLGSGIDSGTRIS